MRQESTSIDPAEEAAERLIGNGYCVVVLEDHPMMASYLEAELALGKTVLLDNEGNILAVGTPGRARPWCLSGPGSYTYVTAFGLISHLSLVHKLNLSRI